MEDRLKEDILAEAARYGVCLNLLFNVISRLLLWSLPMVYSQFYHLCINRYGNKILVTDELPDGQMVDQWEPVSHDSVKTPLEVRIFAIKMKQTKLYVYAILSFSLSQVYEELTNQFLVDYERVPVTDEKSPKEQDFDILVSSSFRTIDFNIIHIAHITKDNLQ